MRKVFMRSSVATFFLILIVCIAAAVVANGCRKTDKIMQPPVTGNTNNNVEQRFFNEHRSADAAEAALVGFIKRKNEKQHFVATTVSRIGYPRWDKAISFKKPSTTAGRGSSADSATVTYVPFVRDSQNYVNAAMVIQSGPIDTSFSYNCDWQYAQKQNSLNSYTDTAEYYAVLFMVMDKRVFGHNKFNIIDTNLFYSGTYKTASIALDTTNSLGRNSELVPIENCQPITIYKIVPCSGKTNSQISGCFQELLSVYCWVEYIETGIGSGGDGGATGGEGDGTPGECNSNPTEGNRTAINNTCGPGWEPVPIDDEPPAASTDPCDIAKDAAKKMDSIYIKANVAAMLDTMATLSHDSLETGFTIFKEFRVSPYTNPDGTKDTTFTGVYSQSDMNIGTTMGISYTYYLPRLFINTATVHFHTSNAFPAQSAHDIYLLIANLLDTHWYDGNFVIAANGSQYAITVSDSAKAIAFFSTKAAFLDTVTNEWKESSLIGKEFDKAKKYFENGDTSKTNYAYEMAMAAVLNSFNSGITLHKKDSNGNFKPILVKTVIPNPNKPKKKIYVQDCL